MPPTVLAVYEPLLPAVILDLSRNLGVGDLDGGRLRLCVPRSLQGVVDQIFEGDPDLAGDT